jgi:hypothetical protein
METLFPFGFPRPTMAYLALYVATLTIHVVFMSYVLAGTAYLGARGAIRRGEDSPLTIVLRDWMPLMLSAAITAGIAPLLFLQILYQQRFYTANLLLFYRWISILPILIAGFYLLYLLRSEHQWLRRSGVRLAVGLAAFVCFGFIAWSWTENHLLSVEGLDVWQREYVSEGVIFGTPELAPRLALWFFGTFPTMALVLSWQLWWLERHAPEKFAGAGEVGCAMARETAGLALAGLTVSGFCGLLYYRSLPEALRDVATGPAALVVTSAGLLTTITGVAVVRECLRIARIDFPALYVAHQDAAEIGGFPVFAVFLIVNSIAIGYCMRLVRCGKVIDR